MYSEKFSNIYYYEKMFFKSVGKERHMSVFLEVIAY